MHGWWWWCGLVSINEISVDNAEQMHRIMEAMSLWTWPPGPAPVCRALKIPQAHHRDDELPKPQAHQLHLSMSCNCGSSKVCCTTQQTKSCIPTGMSTTLSRNWTTHEHELHNREVDHLVNTCICGKSTVFCTVSTRTTGMSRPTQRTALWNHRFAHFAL